MTRGVAMAHSLVALLASSALMAAAHAQCVGAAGRKAQLLSLPQGGTFCLRLPRLLPHPEKSLFGRNVLARTHNDTCGLYALLLHGDDPLDFGPDPHVHYVDEEFWLPTHPNNTIRLFAQSDKTKLRTYMPGEVPGWTVPAITDVGHVDVHYGQIGWSPVGVPYTFMSATPMQGFMAIWLNSGAAMRAAGDIPVMYNDAKRDAEKVMGLTSMWGVPTDISARLFGGPDYQIRALASKAALPPVTAEALQRLQKAFDAGEACFPQQTAKQGPAQRAAGSAAPGHAPAGQAPQQPKAGQPAPVGGRRGLLGGADGVAAGPRLG